MIKEMPAKWFIVASRLRGSLEKAIRIIEEDNQKIKVQEDEINSLREQLVKKEEKLIYLGFRSDCL